MACELVVECMQSSYCSTTVVATSNGAILLFSGPDDAILARRAFSTRTQDQKQMGCVCRPPASTVQNFCLLQASFLPHSYVPDFLGLMPLPAQGPHDACRVYVGPLLSPTASVRPACARRHPRSPACIVGVWSGESRGERGTWRSTVDSFLNPLTPPDYNRLVMITIDHPHT